MKKYCKVLFDMLLLKLTNRVIFMSCFSKYVFRKRVSQWSQFEVVRKGCFFMSKIIITKKEKRACSRAHKGKIVLD